MCLDDRHLRRLALHHRSYGGCHIIRQSTRLCLNRGTGHAPACCGRQGAAQPREAVSSIRRCTVDGRGSFGNYGRTGGHDGRCGIASCQAIGRRVILDKSGVEYRGEDLSTTHVVHTAEVSSPLASVSGLSRHPLEVSSESAKSAQRGLHTRKALCE